MSFFKKNNQSKQNNKQSEKAAPSPSPSINQAKEQSSSWSFAEGKRNKKSEQIPEVILDEERGHDACDDVEPLLTKSPIHNDAKSASNQSLQNRQYKTLNDLKKENNNFSSNKSSSNAGYAEGGDKDRDPANKKLCFCFPPTCIVIIFGLLLFFAFIYEVCVCIVIFYNDMFTRDYAGFYAFIVGVYLASLIIFFYFMCGDRFQDYMWATFSFTFAAVVNLWFFIWNLVYILGYYPHPDVFLRQDMMWLESEWGNHGQDHGHAYIVQTKGEYLILHGGLELGFTIVFGLAALNIYLVYRS